MKKYRVLGTIGDVLTGLGFMTILTAGSVEATSLENDGFITLLIIMAVGLAGVVIGRCIANFSYFEAIYSGVSVVVLAWLYKRLDKRIETMRRAYDINQKIGTYKQTFDTCRGLYEDYIDSKCIEEVNHE